MRTSSRNNVKWRRVWEVTLPLAALATALALIWQVTVVRLFGPGVPVSGQHGDDAGLAVQAAGARERVPKPYRNLTNPLQPTAENVTAGADLYAFHCSFCHGIDGQALTPAARGMRPAPEPFTGPAAKPMSDALMFFRITEGEARTGMPAWGDILTETERWQIILHIRQLQQSPPG